MLDILSNGTEKDRFFMYTPLDYAISIAQINFVTFGEVKCKAINQLP